MSSDGASASQGSRSGLDGTEHDSVASQLTQTSIALAALARKLETMDQSIASRFTDIDTRLEKLERNAAETQDGEQVSGPRDDIATAHGRIAECQDENQPEAATATGADRSREVYETLQDISQASKKDLVLYVQGATEHYKKTPFSGLEEVEARFCEDFGEWTENEFSVAKTELRELRDTLLNLGVPIRKEARLRMSLTLAGHIAALKKRGGHRAQHSMDASPPAKAPESSPTDRWIAEPAQISYPAAGPPIVADPSSRQTMPDSTLYTRIIPKPTDVAKAIPDASRYAGKSDEPFRSKYSVFLRACKITGLPDEDQMLRLNVMEVGFLIGVALDYFQRSVIIRVTTIDEAANMIEEHFLPLRVRSMNETAFNALTLEHVSTLISHPRTNSAVLEEFFIRLERLGRVKLFDAADPHLAARLRDVAMDHPVYGLIAHTEGSYAEMKSVMRERAARSDLPQTRARVRSMTLSQEIEEDAAEEHDAALYTDRVYRTPGYGAQQPHQRRNRTAVRDYKERATPRADQSSASNKASERRYRGPRVCIICGKSGCHSSEHKESFRKALSFISDVALSCNDTEDVHDEPNEESDSEARASVALMMIIQMSSSLQATIPFRGIALDTCANYKNTVGQEVFSSMQIIWPNLKLRKDMEAVSLKGMGGTNHSVGSFDFKFVFGGLRYSINVHVVPGTTPFVMCHATMNALGLSYHSLEGKLVRVADGYEKTIQMYNGLPFLALDEGFETLLSEQELRKIHRAMGHPSVSTLMRTIETSRLSDVPAKDREILERIMRNCHVCQLLGAKPKRFKVSLNEDITGEFNMAVVVDVMFLEECPVLHIVDAGTSFQSAMFLPDLSAETTWRALRRAWIDVYTGPPEWIMCDRGSNFSSSYLHAKAGTLGITVREVPVEAHAEIGLVEREHAVLRKAYRAIRLDCPEAPREDILAMAVRAVNDRAGGDGISATLLAFGVIPRLGVLGKPTSPTYVERSKALQRATKIAREFNAKQAIQTALRQRSGPDMVEVEKLRRLPPGSPVRVFRERGGWTPARLIRVNEHSVDVQLQSGRKSTFTATSVRKLSAIESRPDRTDVGTERPRADQLSSDSPISDGAPSRGSVHEARAKEIQGLIARGTFQVLSRSEIPNGTRVYGMKFVDKFKEGGVCKSRLCVQGFNDKNHGLFVAAPTIQRMSLRMFFCASAMLGFQVHTRDVSQAFLQSETLIRRDIYARAPAEMGLPDDMLLKIIRPLYGLPESPIHWYKTYHDHHVARLGMTAVACDSCLLYKTNGGRPVGIVGLQVDDSIVAGTEEFLEHENREAARFPNKGAQSVTGTPQKFNGVTVIEAEKSYFLSQEIDDLEDAPDDVSFSMFRSIRAKVAYTAHCTRPDLLAYANILSQVTASTFSSKSVASLNELISKSRVRRPLRYRAIPPGNAEVCVFLDAAFGTNEDHSSQVGIVVCIRDMRSSEVNLIHAASMKSRRVARSALAAETLALSEAFDVGYVIRQSMECLLGCSLPLVLYTDARSLYHLTISLSACPTERRLAIDIAAVREAFEKRVISDIVLISGESNPADGCTKTSANGALEMLLDSGTAIINKQAWLVRDKIVCPPLPARELIPTESA